MFVWLFAGAGWGVVAALLWQLRRQRELRALWETVAVDARIEARDQEKLTLEHMRSSYDMATAMLIAHERGVMEAVEDDLRSLAQTLGDSVARAEEHLV